MTDKPWQDRTFERALRDPTSVSETPVGRVLAHLRPSPSMTAELAREAAQAHRSELIKGFGAWLRDRPGVEEKEASISRGLPRRMWIKWRWEIDSYTWRYGLYFPNTALELATLWIRAYVPAIGERLSVEDIRRRWSLLETFNLASIDTGQALGEAVEAFLTSKRMNTIYGWLEGQDVKDFRRHQDALAALDGCTASEPQWMAVDQWRR